MTRLRNPIRKATTRRQLTNAASIFSVLIALLAVASVSVNAQTFEIVHRFTGTPDGSGPVAGLMRDAGGSLYGTTVEGGASGLGTVFKIQKGQETVLYSFTSTEFGISPTTSLVRDKAGNLFGSTNGQFPTIFKLDTQGDLTPLTQEFSLDLSRDAAGNLYGPDGNQVFRLDLNGKLTVLYTFKGHPDGDSPNGNLVLTSAGVIFGTTYHGGVHDCGTVFKISKSGKETVLHSFVCGTSDGEFPLAGLVRDTAGNFYGTTSGGGDSSCNCGTVFKVDPAGALSVLHRFVGGSDGQIPLARLVLDPQGNLYGTTYRGGANSKCHDLHRGGCGTVFKVDPSGEETLLHAFSGEDGQNPSSGLVIDKAGHLFGSTGSGNHGNGVVYKITL